MSTQAKKALRKVTIALGIAEVLLLLGFMVLMLQSSDPMGRAIGQGMAQLAALPLLLFVVPGIALGLFNRLLPLALALIFFAVPVTFVLWRFA